MIKTFKSAEVYKIFRRKFSRKLPRDIQKIALRKLYMIDAAVNISDLKSPPANRLEILKHDRAGQCSIRINQQWRICFGWNDGNAYDLEIVDYH